MGAGVKVMYYVVGDPKLNSGDGVYVKDLEEMKAQLLRLEPGGDWRLIISIHGSEDVIATQGGNLRSRNVPGVYDADAISALFGDEGFRQWRDKHGPASTTMNACQVNLPFERVLLQALNRPQSTQSAQGLGKGCRPHTEILSYRRNPNDASTAVDTRLKWSKLTRQQKQEMQESLADLNKRFGYFGSAPIKEAELLRYYFDEAPKGGWPVVTVSRNYADTGMSFYNRTDHVRFLAETCAEHLGPMRGRTPSAPPVP